MLGRALSTLSVVIVAAACLLSAAAPVAAQSTLVDGSCVVVTSDGLFLVANQTTKQVFDTTPFGGALNAPTVTWIDGTNVFIVTTTKDAAGNAGGVWRVTLAPNGTGSVSDLTPTMPAWIESRFVDADYSPGLDLLFLLQSDEGLIVSWAKPAQATLASLAPWGSVPPGDARSIAVHGAKQPFAVVAALESGPVLRVDKLGTQTLYDAGSFNDIASQPVTGEVIVGKQLDSLIGVMVTSSVMISFNVSGLCGPLVAQPSDVTWDPVAGRAVAIAAEALPPCAFAGGTIGENHIVRLPLAAIGGPPTNVPVLLTPLGQSGITGNRADFALVRHGGSAVTFWGYPGGGAGTSQPEFDHQGPLALGKTAQLQLAHAPLSATAYLVIGLYPAPVVFQGQFIMPAPQSLLPAVTSAAGAAQFALKLPPGATPLVGFEVYMQWVVDDTTTPTGGDIASSQAAVFTIGVK